MTARLAWECVCKSEYGFSAKEFILCSSCRCNSREETQTILLFGLTKSYLILLLKSKTLKFTIWLKWRSYYTKNHRLVSKTGIELLLIDCLSYAKKNRPVFTSAAVCALQCNSKYVFALAACPKMTLNYIVKASLCYDFLMKSG